MENNKLRSFVRCFPKLRIKQWIKLETQWAIHITGQADKSIASGQRIEGSVCAVNLRCFGEQTKERKFRLCRNLRIFGE